MVGNRSTEPAGARTALVVAALTVTAVFVAAAAPTGAWHDEDLPRVYEETSETAGAFGVHVPVEETGDVGVALTGWAPVETSQVSGGLVVYDEDREVRLIFAFTAHGSPERTIISPSPDDLTPSGSWSDGWWTTHAAGDASVLERLDVEVEVLPEDSDVQAQGSHPVIRMATTATDTGPGSLYRTLWVGEVDRTLLEVEADTAVGDVETVAGAAHVKGDPEIQEGQPNVQVQDSRYGATVGVKVMQDASIEVPAEHKLWGFWGLSDFKMACQFQAGACAWVGTAYGLCSYIGVNCSPASVSWDGPGDGDGLRSHVMRDGGRSHVLEGTAPGLHTFTVDHKVDLYGPRVYDGDSGTLLYVGEHHSYLTVADVSLPA